MHSSGVEEVPAESVGEMTWRLTRSPLYATECAAGDVIRLLNQTGEFEIVRRGGNVCVQLYLGPAASDDIRATALVAKTLLRDLAPVGGRMDAQTAGLVSFTVPVTAGFPAIEKVLRAATTRSPGAQWQYANVYHPTTGEPLRWWDAPHR